MADTAIIRNETPSDIVANGVTIGVGNSETVVYNSSPGVSVSFTLPGESVEEFSNDITIIAQQTPA